MTKGTACDGCPSLPDLAKRYESAGGRYLVCPLCFNAKDLDDAELVSNAKLGGCAQRALSTMTRDHFVVAK